MPNPIKIPFPKRGVNRNFDRSDQNGIPQGFGSTLIPETVWNALNVLPYDRFDRLRGGQRPGTVRLFSNPLDLAVVAGLWQTTIAIDPSTLPPSFITEEEIFNYPNGNFMTVASPSWNTMTNPVFPFVNTTSNASAYTIVSHVLTPQSNQASAIWNGTNPLTPQFAVKGTFNLTDTQTTAHTGSGVMAWVDRANYNNINQIIYAFFNRHHVSLYQGNNTQLGTVTFGTQLSAGSHTIEMSVTNAGVLVVYVDGVQQISFTTGTLPLSGQNGTGIYSGTIDTCTDWQLLVATPQTVYRKTSIIAVVNGSVYQGDETGLTLTTNGGHVISTFAVPSFTYADGFGYFVDGSSIQKLNLSSQAIVTYSATAGTAPVGCTIAATYRDRLVLAAPVSNPQNFFMSRVGTQTDWDYSQTDPAAAFAGNASTAGRIGEPITALMPFTDDVMLIGGDHNLWRITGDPADGGSIDMVSDSIGVLGQYAWTKDPNGIIYFLGNAGLYRIAPTGQPELLTGSTYNAYFTGLNRTTNYINLRWDPDRQGMYIFVTPIVPGTPGTHLWYDARNAGLWPIQYPDSHGPVSAITYNGDGPNDRFVLLGGRTGLVQKVLPSALNDDGTAISSFITLGPIQPASPAGDAILSGLDVTLGENAPADLPTNINVQWKVQGGKSAYEVTEGTPRHFVAGTYSYPGRQTTRTPRLRGGWFSLNFSNATLNTYWSLEEIVMHIENQGRQR